MTKRLKSFTLKHLREITLALVVVQPAADVISYWLAFFGISNYPTLILRLLLLAATFFCGFAVSSRKRAYLAFIVIAALIAAGHAAPSAVSGYIAPVSDLTNYVRVLLTPVTALALISFLRTEKGADSYDSIKIGFTFNLFFIAAVVVIATVTGTDPHTYAYTGVIGWFSNTNSQSAILSSISPVAVAFTYMRFGIKHPLFMLSLASSALMLYFFGTRLAFAGLVAVTIGIAVSIVIVSPKKMRDAAAIFFVGAVLLLCAPLSPMAKHQKNYQNVQSERQDSVDDITGSSLSQSPSDMTDDEKSRLAIELAPIYEKYIPDFVEMFGVQRTAELYNYSSDIAKITATRPKKLIFAKLLMQDSPAVCRLFGIELARFTVDGNNYDVENDFHGIYYLYGAVGLGAMLIFIGYFIFLILRRLISKIPLPLDAFAWGISLVMTLAHAFFTAGVLRRPSASFYLAVSLAAVYYLTRIKSETGENK